MGKRTRRYDTTKARQAAYSKNLLHFGLLRGFAAKVGRHDLEEKYTKVIVKLLGYKI